MDKSILFHVKYTIAVVKFKLHQGQIHGFFALCMMFRSLQFASAHSLRFASPRISLAVCTQPYMALSPLVKTSANGQFLNCLHALSTFSQRLYSTWYLVVLHISMMVDILGATILFFFFSLTYSPPSNNAQCTLIYLPFCPHA